MNRSEQQTHRTVTAELARGLEDIATATDDRFTELEARIRAAISDERTHRLQLAQEQRGYVDNEDRLLRQCCQERWDASSAATKRIADRHAAFVTLTFWQRLRWILRGSRGSES